MSFLAGLTWTNARVEGSVLFLSGGFGIVGAFWTLNLISILAIVYSGMIMLRCFDEANLSSHLGLVNGSNNYPIVEMDGQ